MGVAVADVAAAFLVVVCTTGIPVVFVIGAPNLGTIGKAVVVTIDTERQRQLDIELEVAVFAVIYTEQDQRPDDGPDVASDIERCHHSTADPKPARLAMRSATAGSIR
jgi:hypothetical protein